MICTWRNTFDAPRMPKYVEMIYEYLTQRTFLFALVDHFYCRYFEVYYDSTMGWQFWLLDC